LHKKLNKPIPKTPHWNDKTFLTMAVVTLRRISTRRRVRFNDATTSIGRASTATEWHDSTQINDLFSVDLEKARRGDLPSPELRGLESHLSNKRTKFTKMYVQAVVQKSLALRSAKYLGKKVRVEEELQKFALKHSKASALIAQQVANMDQQAALDIHNPKIKITPSRSGSFSSTTSNRQRSRRRKMVPPTA
jgi:hypothetical protein